MVSSGVKLMVSILLHCAPALEVIPKINKINAKEKLLNEIEARRVKRFAIVESIYSLTVRVKKNETDAQWSFIVL